MMVLPWFSGRFASSEAAHIAAPDEMPTRSPSDCESRRLVRMASSSLTQMTSSTMARLKVEGIKLAPMP